jgi:hypothetical protein
MVRPRLSSEGAWLAKKGADIVNTDHLQTSENVEAYVFSTDALGLRPLGDGNG